MSGSLVRRCSILAVLVAVAATLVCSRPSLARRAADKKYSIAVIPKGLTHVFWQSIHAGANRAGKELGVEIRWQGPQNEQERAAQIRIVDDMLTQGVDAIVLAPIDRDALVEAIDEAAKKVPVVLIDSGAKTESYKSYIATDNHKGGQLAGQKMLELLPDGGEIAVVKVTAGSQSTQEREDGFREVVSKNPKIKIVAEQYGDSDRGKSQRVAGDILAAHPNLKGFYGPNEPSAFGILAALQDFKKKPGEVQFVGFDASEELAKGLDDGFIQALVLQNPIRMGYEGVKAAVATLKGEQVKKDQPIEPVLATPQNKDEPKVKELLRPDLSKDL